MLIDVTNVAEAEKFFIIGLLSFLYPVHHEIETSEIGLIKMNVCKMVTYNNSTYLS